MLRKFLRHFIARPSNRKPLRRSLRIEQCELRHMLSAVPVFQSDPDSLNRIYLDFDGHTIEATEDPYVSSQPLAVSLLVDRL